jgi:NAD(P)-dependent dehydrogenase (short-subunit alcohol dehydrogenase family)
VGHTIEVFDLTTLDEIPRWVKRVADEGGAFHGLVHSAGLFALIPVAGVTVRKLEELMRVNLSAAIMLGKGFRQKGCSASGGSMVLISAALGLVGAAGATIYSATKAALIGATRSLAVELAREKIRVNSIAPGVVDTEMTQRLWADLPPKYRSELEKMYPLGFGTARDVAYGAAYLIADTGRWVTGTTLVIDGGFTAR